MRQTRADILAYIQQNGPCFKTDVAKAVGITQSGVSRHVEHLIADGLVRNAPFSLKVESVPVAPPAMAVIVEGLKAVNDQNRGAAGEWPEKWGGDCTVGNMIANLKTLPPEMPLYTAYHIPMGGEPSLLRVKRPTMSRERVDGITIKTGDESVPYSAVIWTQPQNPLEAHPSPTPAADADRVRMAVQNGVARSMAADDQWKELSPPARAVLMLNVCRHVNEALAALKSEGSR